MQCPFCLQHVQVSLLPGDQLGSGPPAVRSVGPYIYFRSCMVFVLKPFQNVLPGAVIQVKELFLILISVP